MYFTNDSLLSENMPPLMITAALYRPISTARSSRAARRNEV